MILCHAACSLAPSPTHIFCTTTHPTSPPHCRLSANRTQHITAYQSANTHSLSRRRTTRPALSWPTRARPLRCWAATQVRRRGRASNASMRYIRLWRCCSGGLMRTHRLSSIPVTLGWCCSSSTVHRTVVNITVICLVTIHVLAAAAEVCVAAYKYGMHLGIAFQLVDDMLGWCCCCCWCCERCSWLICRYWFLPGSPLPSPPSQ